VLLSAASMLQYGIMIAQEVLLTKQVPGVASVVSKVNLSVGVEAAGFVLIHSSAGICFWCSWLVTGCVCSSPSLAVHQTVGRALSGSVARRCGVLDQSWGSGFRDPNQHAGIYACVCG